MNALSGSRRPPLRATEGYFEDSAPVYRLRPANGNATPHRRGLDVSAGLSWAALLIGLIPVSGVLGSGTVWGAEPTLGLMMSALGAMGLAGHYACAWRARCARRVRAQCRSRASKQIRKA